MFPDYLPFFMTMEYPMGCEGLIRYTDLVRCRHPIRHNYPIKSGTSPQTEFSYKV